MATVIIAGSRTITDDEFVFECIVRSGYNVTEVVSGRAAGVDICGEHFAELYSIPVKYFPADWRNINVPNAVVKTNRFGKPYNAAGGHQRNEAMAKYAAKHSGSCIVIWDGVSKGSLSMRDLAIKYGLPLYFVKSRPTVPEFQSWVTPELKGL